MNTKIYLRPTVNSSSRPKTKPARNVKDFTLMLLSVFILINKQKQNFVCLDAYMQTRDSNLLLLNYPNGHILLFLLNNQKDKKERECLTSAGPFGRVKPKLFKVIL
jgi:hypothetical protein